MNNEMPDEIYLYRHFTKVSPLGIEFDIELYPSQYDLSSGVKYVRADKAVPVGVPTCFRSLVKYAEWQTNEGANYHPTLPSCVAECKAMLFAAPTPAQPEKLDVEALKKSDRRVDYPNGLSEQGVGRILGWNDCIEHISSTYDFVKKEQK